MGATPTRDDSARGLANLVSQIEAMPPGLGWYGWSSASQETLVGDVRSKRRRTLPAASRPDGILPRRHWGKGFATEATRVLPLAWSMGLDEVIATIVPVNLPSIHVVAGHDGPTGRRRRGGLARSRNLGSATPVTRTSDRTRSSNPGGVPDGLGVGGRSGRPRWRTRAVPAGA